MVILHPIVIVKTANNAIIVRFVFDTILAFCYIKTCGYHKVNVSKQQSFFLGYSMKFSSNQFNRIAEAMKFMLLVGLVVLGYWATASSDYVKVVDGDSLEIGARRIRLQGIDAPEFKQYCFDAQKKRYQCGIDSRNHLRQLLKKSNYKVKCHMLSKDRYKRELSECFVGDKNINLEMINAGYAVAYRAEKQDYFEAEKTAKQGKKGIWQGKFMRPEYYRRLNRR